MKDTLFGALVGGGAACVAVWITIRQQGLLSRHEILQSRFADAYVTLHIFGGLHLAGTFLIKHP